MKANFTQNSYEYVPNTSYEFQKKFNKYNELHTYSYPYFIPISLEIQMKFKRNCIWSSYEKQRNFILHSYAYVPHVSYEFHWKFILRSYELHANYKESAYEFPMHYIIICVSALYT